MWHSCPPAPSSPPDSACPPTQTWHCSSYIPSTLLWNFSRVSFSPTSQGDQLVTEYSRFGRTYAVYSTALVQHSIGPAQHWPSTALALAAALAHYMLGFKLWCTGAAVLPFLPPVEDPPPRPHISSSCCSMASACCILWISRVSPISLHQPPKYGAEPGFH